MPQLARHQKEAPLPILYSFRRCPYAIRARMTIAYAGIQVELRDILLKEKPEAMIAASPKATVPVLKLANDRVIDESFDIMLWALSQSDPKEWLPGNVSTRDDIFALIEENDGPFKQNLDRYKYHVRFPEKAREDYRFEGEKFLKSLERRLSDQIYLFSEKITLADMAIFPFIRQFGNADIEWFNNAPYPHLQSWLKKLLSTELFTYVMKKRPIWKDGTSGELFPQADGR